VIVAEWLQRSVRLKTHNVLRTFLDILPMVDLAESVRRALLHETSKLAILRACLTANSVQPQNTRELAREQLFQRAVADCIDRRLIHNDSSEEA